jgi:hypothetical protein
LDYQQFHRFLESGETASCIFMKDCEAFNGSLIDDAELVKHIIALANNETAMNYIIVGVSSDCEYKSFDNRNLTDDTLQNFCKESIAPSPIVKLDCYTWEDANDDILKGKIFVVIQVQSQARQCFRFNQEFYNPQKNCYFKKGEVWVRHNTNTVFASPEEIKKLFEKKQINQLSHKIDYTNFPYATTLPYILDELEQLVSKVGGKICSDIDPFIVRGGPSLFHHIVIPINGKPLLLRIVPVEKCVKKGQIDTLNNIYLTFEHGMLLISLGNVSETAADLSRSKLDAPWGYFCTHQYWHSGLKERKLDIPLSEVLKPIVGDPSSLCFVFANVANSEILSSSWTSLITALQTEADLIQTIATNTDRINTITASYLKEGCPLPTNKTFKPKNLLENEMWTPEKYGNVLLNRQPEICNALQYLVDKMKD